MVEGIIKPLVTITGVSGFVGSQICLEFLKSGQFRVRGTVRDRNSEAKIGPIRKAFAEHFIELELINADLLDANAIDQAIQGATYVVHTASPVINTDDEDAIVKPAVEGTMAVLQACHKHKVKRLVITSSILSITSMLSQDKPDPETGFYDEKCWGNPKRTEGAYLNLGKSKTLAERAAWDFQQSLPEEERFEIVAICPSFVVGPVLIPGGFLVG